MQQVKTISFVTVSGLRAPHPNTNMLPNATAAVHARMELIGKARAKEV